MTRLAAPLGAAVVTSAVVAAIALGGQAATQTDPPAPTGQPAGELTIGGGAPIPILAFSAGVSNTATPGGGGTGVPTFSVLRLVKPVDVNTPSLLVAVANGAHVQGGATFSASWSLKDGSAKIVYDLGDVIVASASQSGGGGEPTESVSLSFGEVHWTYTRSDKNGTTTQTSEGGWDVEGNTEK